MAGSNQTIQKFRVIQGGRAGVGNGLAEGLKKETPMLEEPDPLAQTRKGNRLMLAKEYNGWHPLPLRRGWAPRPKAEIRRRIESISQQPDELKAYLGNKLDDNQIDLTYRASRLARTLRNRPNTQERARAAQKLAFLASDPDIYGNATSVAALSGLVKAASHGIREAKDALLSLGLDPDSIIRETGTLVFSVGATARRAMRLFSRGIDVALRKLENRMGLEL